METLCYEKEAGHRETNAVRFHEGQKVEWGCQGVTERACGVRVSLVQFPLGTMKKFWRGMAVMAA